MVYLWYGSGKDDADESKDDQMLAIWLSLDETLNLFYSEVKDLYNRDSWEEIFSEVPERELLNRCAKEWLDNMDKEYGSDSIVR